MEQEIDSISDSGTTEALVEGDDPTISNATPSSENNNIPLVPALFTSLPAIRDHLVTTSSIIQDETVQNCLPLLAGRADSRKSLFDFSPHGVARLERDDHVRALTDLLQNARYTAYDAQRPWCLYWALTGLALLDEDVEQYRQGYHASHPI